MNKNAKLYVLKYDDCKEVIFRDLTCAEYAQVQTIKNVARKYEMIAKYVIIEDENKAPWAIKMLVGKEAYENTGLCISNNQILEITVKQFRESVKNDFALWCIDKILRTYPGQKISDLLQMTHKDLIELVCACEYFSETKHFKVKGGMSEKKSKGIRLLNPDNLPDGGAAIMERIRNIEK